jgi:transporter family protein
MVKKLETWLVFTLAAMLLWGTWCLLAKLALNYVGWKQLLITQAIATFAVYVIIYIVYKPTVDFRQAGFQLALLAGVLQGIGGVLFYIALSQGKASVIVPLSALYPLVTIVLAFVVLKEQITLLQGAGIVFALVSIFLISL